MNLPATLRTYLLNSRLPIRVRTASAAGPSLLEGAGAAGIAAGELVRAVAIRVGGDVMVAVVPAARELDFSSLKARFGRTVAVCGHAELRRLFFGCDEQLTPPVPAAWGLPAVVDTALDAMPRLFFTAGRPGMFLQAELADFLALQGECLRIGLTVPPPQVLGSGERLPSMPGMAAALLTLKSDQNAGPREVARVIERDPSLSAQLLRYARSPLYGFRGSVECVEDGIRQVLGTEFALHMGLGIALGRNFTLPRRGPLGLDAYWNHALHCAALTQALATAMESRRRPPRGMAWLAGLLHNFGLLLLGEFSPREYALLAAACAAEPDSPLAVVESRILSCGHAEIGARLLAAWRLPEEVVAACAWHHEPERSGRDPLFPALVQLANRLLAQVGIGDEGVVDVTGAQCEPLGLSVEEAERALAFVLQDERGLGWMANAMAA